MDTTIKKFDYKREFKEFYLPKNRPTIIEIPKMNYLAVRGSGDPNREDGEYKKSIELLYSVIFTIKMSYRGGHGIPGFFDFVVPPLEGFWWQKDSRNGNFDYSRKEDMNFISVIRLPDFVTRAEFDWAIAEATVKKTRDFSRVEFLEYDEGLSVQCMHIGAYDNEPATISLMHQYMSDNNYELDIQNPRYHHEIYLSDPRRTSPDKLRTVLRHPIKSVA